MTRGIALVISGFAVTSIPVQNLSDAPGRRVRLQQCTSKMTVKRKIHRFLTHHWGQITEEDTPDDAQKGIAPSYEHIHLTPDELAQLSQASLLQACLEYRGQR
jgi:hypothetical protein